MKSRVWLWSIAILCATLARSSQLTAQNNPQHHPKHHQYRLYDMGTFGGPNSYGSYGSITFSVAGVVGWADTTDADPYCWVDCMAGHAFQWRNGHLFDLGALPGSGNSSYAYAINNSGLIVGVSENGAIDPDTGYPSTTPVAWLNGHIFSLGGFGGTQGYAAMVNNRGQIVGASSNTTPDPYGGGQWFPTTTQLRAFVWENGRMRDIGTLGAGTDAWALYVSDSGLVVGRSYTGATNPDTGNPILDAFLWDGRRMIDLGNFGGDWSWPAWVNNKGQVTGYSLSPAGTVHAFLWDHGRLTDIGTPGEYSSGAFWINEAGVVTGFENLTGYNPAAALWKNGRETILPILPGYDCWAQGNSLNNAQQVVGISQMCDGTSHGFLWENGDTADLNALVQPPSDLVVSYPLEIDDRGEIMSHALDAEGNTHAVLLVPSGDCDHDCERRIEDSRNNSPVVRPATPGTTMPSFGKTADWLGNRYGQRSGMTMTPHVLAIK